ncbi:hypothetical protein ColKHC_10647 [Colletotrichum higginsianum]|nr:hypothetical protein ColKHC_10647 [Colletotrichum higginsianum]
MLLSEDDHGHQHSIEGLAYASIQPVIKEKLAGNADFLKKLVKTLADAPPKSPVTYGALSILVNLTRYQPSLTEEEKKMNQLKAYAAAAGKSAGPDPLNDNDHVTERCKRVFEAGVTPVLVTHSKNGSPASLSLTVAIIYSLSVTTSLRGKLAQQGAVKLLLAAWVTLPESEAADPAAETRDLLPTFEALMALTNLASTDDLDTRRAIVRVAWPQIEDQLLSSNARVSKAAVELVCNLVQAAEGMALYADGSPQAKGRLHILLALADAEDEGTRSAAGGALAALTGHENVVQAVVERERGVKVILDMCADDNEDLRHRAGFIVYNMVAAEGAPGANARKKIIEEGGLEALKEAAKKSRRAEVVEVLVQALKILLDDNRARLFNPVQYGDALDVTRLREEVEADEALNVVPRAVAAVAANQDADVAGLGVDVAAHVDDAPGPVAQQLAEEVVVAALAGRVDDDDGLVGRVTWAKSWGASAAMKLHCDSGRSLRRAFLRAHSMESLAMSMPVLPRKREARVIVKRPEPE